VESSQDFFNNLQQVVCLAPWMRLVYRTNFAGMYNDISQVVYFHHPKFAKQPQLKIIDILKSSLNTLPLMTQIFPHIQVYYDDDSFIPFLSETDAVDTKTPSETDRNRDMLIEDFVHKRMYMEEPTAVKKDKVAEESRFAWLICCSSVFLIDSKMGKIFSSYDASLLPLLSHMKTISESDTIKDAFENVSDDSLHSDRNFKIDLGTAHGHVCLL
jgi:hypothetical protein